MSRVDELRQVRHQWARLNRKRRQDERAHMRGLLSFEELLERDRQRLIERRQLNARARHLTNRKAYYSAIPKGVCPNA